MFKSASRFQQHSARLAAKIYSTAKTHSATRKLNRKVVGEIRDRRDSLLDCCEGLIPVAILLKARRHVAAGRAAEDGLALAITRLDPPAAVAIRSSLNNCGMSWIIGAKAYYSPRTESF